MIGLAPQAMAQDACGALDNGVAVCDPSLTYVDGVHYEIAASAPPQDLTIHLGEGTVVDTSGHDAEGVSAINGAGGAVTLSGGQALSITTDGDRATGVRGEATGGPVSIEVGDVNTFGYRANGVSASTNFGPEGGSILIKTGTVATYGDGANGVVAEAYHGDIDIDAAAVFTNGAGAQAIYAASNTGNVTVTADQVVTRGDGGRGVFVSAGGAAVVKVDDVFTLGEGEGVENNSAGVKAVGTSVNVEVGHVTTRGDYAVGIYANTNHVVFDTTIAQPDIAVKADGVATAGYAAHGIVAINTTRTGAVSVAAGSVTTEGQNAFGVYATGSAGVTVNVDRVLTQSAGSRGVDVIAHGGDVDITTGTVTTSGAGSVGVGALNYSDQGKVTVTAGSVKTTRDYAGGIDAEAYGDVAVKAGSVSTNGFQSFGLLAFSVAGDIKVQADDVQTHGDNANGVNVTANGALSVDVGKVQVTGDHSTGVYAMTNTGGGVVHVDDVSTSGAGGLGIGAFNFSNQAISVSADSITTSGAGATGLIVVSYGGAINVDVDQITTSGKELNGQTGSGVNIAAHEGDMMAHFNTVSTSGDFATAVTTFNVAADQHLTVDKAVVTAGDHAQGIASYEAFGNAVLDIKASVTTTGAHSGGIRAYSNSGDITVNASGAITTSGDGATGIYSHAFSSGRQPYAQYGETEPEIHDGTLHLIASSIHTSGARSNGIEAVSEHQFDYGDSPIITNLISIRAGDIAVSGEASIGVLVDSRKAFDVDVGATRSTTARALDLTAGTSAALTIRGATVSGAAEGAVINAQDASITITGGGSVTGATDGLVISARGDVAPTLRAAATLAAGPSGKIILTNAGVLSAGTGYALVVNQGAAKITNSGQINGRIQLADGDDVLTNTGIFNADRDSDFGAGADTFVNSGVVQVLGHATSAAAVALNGLERFENAGGLVDLRNGHTGDKLTLAGDYVGSGQARLGLDVSKTGADSLVVQGAATGKTTILLGGVSPSQAVLNAAGPALVTVGAGSDAGAFSLANADIGFVRYGLKYNAATRAYSLVSAAGDGVYRTAKLAGAARDIRDRSGQAWSAHLAGLRDARWAGDTSNGRLWGQALGGSDSRDDAGSTVDADGSAHVFSLDYKQTWRGFQAGGDIARPTLGGADAVVGLSGGYISSDLDFADSQQKATFHSYNLGAYASATRGLYFANALAQYVHHAIDSQDNAWNYETSAKGKSLGVQLEAGARLGSRALAFEPLLGLAYARNTMGRLTALGQTFDFDRAAGLEAKLGGRVSGQTALANGDHLVFSAGGAVLHAFGGRQDVTFTSGDQSQSIGDGRAKTYGQGVVGLTWLTRRGLSAYVQGQGDAGHGYKSTQGQIGVRLPF